MTRRPLCTCGHAYAAHRGAEWRPHRKGTCKHVLPPVVVVYEYGEDVLEEATPCPCAFYVPATPPQDAT